MAKQNYDLSQYGATPIDEDYDLSKFGGIPIEENSMPKPTRFDPSFAEKLAPNVLAGLAQMGHSILNSPSNIAKYAASKGWINPQTANSIPRQQDYDFSKMLMLPGTTADKFVQGAAKSLPYLAAPEAKLGMVGRGIEAIPGVGKFASGALSRMIPQAGVGAVMNENPAEGAGMAAGTQGALEALSAPLKAVGGIAEFVNPKKYASSLTEAISNQYKMAEQKASDFFNPVLEKHGMEPVYSSNSKEAGMIGEEGLPQIQYKDLDEKTINKYFSPTLKKLHSDFAANPTINNAHLLQSHLYKEISDLSRKPPGAFTNNTIQTYDYARKLLKNDLQKALGRADPNALASYNAGGEVTKNEVVPFRSNSVLYKIANGDIKSIEPNRLQKALNISSEKGAIPENHFLNAISEKLGNKISRGDLARNLGSIGLGAGVGEYLEPGWGGAAGGAAAGKFLTPAMVKVIQNEYLGKQAAKASPYYDLLKKSLVGYNMNRQ